MINHIRLFEALRRREEAKRAADAKREARLARYDLRGDRVIGNGKDKS